VCSSIDVSDLQSPPDFNPHRLQETGKTGRMFAVCDGFGRLCSSAGLCNGSCRACQAIGSCIVRYNSGWSAGVCVHPQGVVNESIGVLADLE